MKSLKAPPAQRLKLKVCTSSGLTSRYGFVAAVAARRVLSGAALPTHDTVVFGAEGLLGQRLVTLCAAETLLVPEPALMTELLREDGCVTRGEMKSGPSGQT